MKRFLPLMIVLISYTGMNAQTSQLLMSENFTSYNNGNLYNQGGWGAYGNTDRVQVSSSSPLFYSGYTSGSKYVTTAQGGDYGWFGAAQPDDPYKGFIGSTTVSTGVATTYYMSFVVRVPNASGTKSTSSARPTVALRTNNGSILANFYIADDGGSSDLKFGIGKDYNNDGNYATTNYNFGTTYLIVIRYDIVTGSNNDKMYLWVNPSLASEPTTASAKVALTTNGDGYTSSNVNSLLLVQEDNSATAAFDAFKISYANGFSNVAANSLASWNALSPIGVPLPVKFGDIKGYAKNTGIQLDWTVYTELNVARYEIERSGDGVSFTSAGITAAKNAEGTLYYDFFDAAPLSGNNFYRIKNVDIDGKYSYSSIIKVSLDKAAVAGLSIYPNPVTNNHVSLSVTDLQRGEYKIEITNMTGQQVYAKQLNHAGGNISQSIELPAAIKTGIYTIQVKGSAFKTAKTFLVR